MKDMDIDLTIILTHIGYENDLRLAEKIDPACGVDIIIGGHSHTRLEQPASVNNILIVQAGIGTDQIGRFEIDIDKETNSVADYTWQTIEINEHNCKKDRVLEKLIHHYKEVTDAKYSEVLTRIPEKICHEHRYEETAVGNMFCDIMLDQYKPDLVLIGSGSLRKSSLGPVITKGDLMDMYPYDEYMKQIILTGQELKNGIRKILFEASKSNKEHLEYYQISKGFCFVLDKSSGELMEATRNGKPISDTDEFKVGIEGYHFNNMHVFLGVDLKEVTENRRVKSICINIRNAVEEYMKEHTHFTTSVEGRTKII